MSFNSSCEEDYSDQYDQHLFQFEKVKLYDYISPCNISDEELNSKYVSGEIRIVTEQARYSLAGILKMLTEEVENDDGTKELRYKLDPDYQRRHRWSNVQKSRLIESFLMNVPVPPIFLYECDLARFEVMDGRQRLTALKDFYSDALKLQGLQYWTGLEGRTYSQLPNKIRDGINRRYISSIILLKETAKSDEQAKILKQIVFERLNSGGVKLSSQETRNAVYSGPLNDLCRELSLNKKFRKMWDIPLEIFENGYAYESQNEYEHIRTTKSGKNLLSTMEDVELVLRFFAYRKINEFKPGLNRISELLDRFIAIGNKFSSDELDIYRKMFNETIDFLYDLIGSEAFTTLSTHKHKPNKIIYDPLMFVASNTYVKKHYLLLLKNKTLLCEKLKYLYNEKQSLFAGRSTNTKAMNERNKLLFDTFKDVIEHCKNSEDLN